MMHVTTGSEKQKLIAEAISVHFEGLTALNAVTLEMGRDEVHGLIGPNGAGKTTLVNVMTGFQKPSHGRVVVAGQDLTGNQPILISKAGVSRTFQSGRLFGNLSILDNVSSGAIAHGLAQKTARRHAKQLLEWLGIGKDFDRRANTLSYADQRRVGVARALATGPRFILLDEPAAGMSEAECESLIHVIREIPSRYECGVLLIEHNMRVVMDVCTRIHVLDGGRTIAKGSPTEVTSDKVVVSAYLGGKK